MPSAALDLWTPTRLCCGTKHWGSVCPGGLVMCCICFERVPVDRLTVEPDGCRVDVCMSCTIDEAYVINNLPLDHPRRDYCMGRVREDGQGS